MRRFVLTLVLLLATQAAGCVAARAPMTVSGTLQGELTWRGTVFISGDVVLAKGSSLTLLPGTEVLFLPPRSDQQEFVEHPYFPGSELIVRGSLAAEGTAEAPILFASADPGAPAGSWGAINIEEAPSASFRYCLFRQADSAVHARQSQVFIEQSIFEENLVGIRFHSTDMLIENNLLRRNGAAIRFHFGAPVICRNQLTDNGRGFFITSHPRDYRIEANNIVGSRDYAVVLGEEVPEQVPMARNFWGTMDVREIEAGLFDHRRDPALGKVVYAPLAQQPIEEAGPSWTR